MTEVHKLFCGGSKPRLKRLPRLFPQDSITAANLILTQSFHRQMFTKDLVGFEV